MSISEKKKEVIKRELLALGQDYRLDWSCFDGRTFKAEMEIIVNFIDSDKEDFSNFSNNLKHTEKKI